MEHSNEIVSDDDHHERMLDRRILAFGLGMEKRFVQKKEPLQYYLDQELMPQLHRLFRQLQEVNWEHLLENANNFDVLQTRDEMCTWLMRLRSARQERDQLPADYPRWEIEVSNIFPSCR